MFKENFAGEPLRTPIDTKVKKEEATTDGTDVVGAIDPNRPGAVQVYRPYRYTAQGAEDAEDQTGFTE